MVFVNSLDLLSWLVLLFWMVLDFFMFWLRWIGFGCSVEVRIELVMLILFGCWFLIRIGLLFEFLGDRCFCVNVWEEKMFWLNKGEFIFVLFEDIGCWFLWVLFILWLCGFEGCEVLIFWMFNFVMVVLGVVILKFVFEWLICCMNLGVLVGDEVVVLLVLLDLVGFLWLVDKEDGIFNLLEFCLWNWESLGIVGWIVVEGWCLLKEVFSRLVFFDICFFGIYLYICLCLWGLVIFWEVGSCVLELLYCCSCFYSDCFVCWLFLLGINFWKL